MRCFVLLIVAAVVAVSADNVLEESWNKLGQVCLFSSFSSLCFDPRAQEVRSDAAAVRAATRSAVSRVQASVGDLRQRVENQFQAPKTHASKWSAPTIFVPGHSLDATSFRKAVEYGSTGGNGAYAAVYSASDRKWHQQSARGPLLTSAQVAATNMVIVDFSDRFGGRQLKAREIVAAVQALRRARGATQPLQVNVVTHSAGDADFDTAAASGALDSLLRVRNRIAIGPVFDGTYVGSLGGKVLDRLGRVGQALGAQAADELAENSADIRQLQAAQLAMKNGFYKNTRRVDIQTNGVAGITPRLADHTLGAGDGFVQSSQRRPFVAETRVVNAVDPTALNHLFQPGFGGVLTQVNDILSH